MKILVANLGSTSFKYRLFDMADERQLARGGVERIGAAESPCFVEIGGKRQELNAPGARPCGGGAAVPGAADRSRRRGCLQGRRAKWRRSASRPCMADAISGVQRVTPDVLAAMEEMSQVAPAHNPPYIAAMRLLGEKLPEIPLVAAFETGFHADDRPTAAAVLRGPVRVGREAARQAVGLSRREPSLHRARGRPSCSAATTCGSSRATWAARARLCAIRGGKSVATTMGMSPQTGLPHNNRVGDFDPFAIAGDHAGRRARRWTRCSTTLAEQSGPARALSGVSGDVRDLEEAAAQGNARAQLALDVFVAEIRRHLGGMLVELGGADAIVFTGGIGENGVEHARGGCARTGRAGHRARSRPPTRRPRAKRRSAPPDSRAQIWIVPTNEELIVARQTKQLLQAKG